MQRSLRLSFIVGLFWATIVAGAQVIYDAELGEDLLVNLTPNQSAVAYELDLPQPQAVEVDVTYLGEPFPFRLDVLLTDGTPITSQPISAAGPYELDLDTGNYYLLFIADSGATGRLVARLTPSTGSSAAVVAQNPTPTAVQSDTVPAQPGSNVAQPGAVTNPETAAGGNDTPAPDQDGDSVPDAEDVCIATPGNPANAGCPLPSESNNATNPTPVPPTPTTAPGDGLAAMPLEVTPAATAEGDFTPSRPSNVDRDSDNVPDNVDACPDEAGVATTTGAPTHGCPQGASGGFLPEPGEYTFTSVRSGCYTGTMTDIPADQAYESFIFITPGGDGNSIVASFEGKDENVFTRDANSPQLFSLRTPLANVEDGRRVEAFVFDSDPIEYYDLTLDPRNTSCYGITWYELTRVSDATTREERAENMQSGGDNANVNTGGANDALAGTYQADLSQSGRGCEDSEVVFPDSGVSVQLSVAVAPNGTDLIVTSQNGQSVTFMPAGGNTYAADDGSLRLVITVENDTITRYAEYQLSGGSCEVTRIYEAQKTGETEQTAEEPTGETESGSGVNAPDFAEIGGQPISEGEWAATGELAGIGCPGAEEWNTVTANQMDLDFNFSLAFTPEGVESTQTGTTLLTPTGEPNTFRFDETGVAPYIEIIQFDSPDTGTLSRYMNPASCAGAFRWTITYVGS